VVYAKLFDADPRTLEPVALNGKRRLSVPALEVRILQRAAHEAITRYSGNVDAVAPADKSEIGQRAGC
jgi:hypothetical protein